MLPDRRARFGLLLGAALLTGVAAASVPLPSPVGHDDDHVHIEVDHGGHGPTLIDQSERIGGRTPAPAIVAVAAPLPPVDLSGREVRALRAAARMPGVRAPPANPSRAPPLAA